MPTTVDVKIANIEKLTELASNYPAIARKHIDRAIALSLIDIQDKAQPITPVKTRRLWSDLQYPHLSPFQGWIGSDLPCAVFVHDK